MQVCTSLQTDNHASTPPLRFLQAGRPSCHPTNSVKALKACEQELVLVCLSVCLSVTRVGSVWDGVVLLVCLSVCHTCRVCVRQCSATGLSVCLSVCHTCRVCVRRCSATGLSVCLSVCHTCRVCVRRCFRTRSLHVSASRSYWLRLTLPTRLSRSCHDSPRTCGQHWWALSTLSHTCVSWDLSAVVCCYKQYNLSYSSRF